MLDRVHGAFRNHVKRLRPNADIEKIADGNIWLGQDAKALGLVDMVTSSDAYIAGLIQSGAKVVC